MAYLTGGAVRLLQTNLNERRRARGRDAIDVDGKLGAETRQAVHVAKYDLGFPMRSLDTGPSWWFRRVVQHPGLRPPSYLARASGRKAFLARERAKAAKAGSSAGAFGIDWAWGTPNISAFVKAGVDFACRYLSNDPSKNLSRAQAQALTKAGIDCVVVWEATANRALSGRSGGVADARVARAQAHAAGAPDDAPIYFAVDFDASPAQMGAIGAYMAGAASVLGKGRVGAYGGFHVIKALFDAGRIVYGWQTYAWSGGAWDRRAQLQQYSNGHTLGGVGCDYNRSTRARFGQWRVA